MGKSFGAWGALPISIALWLCNTSAHASGSVALPCSAAPVVGSTGKSALRPCAVVQPETLKRLEQRIVDQVAGYYQGCDIDFSKIDDGAATSDAGTPARDAKACRGLPYLTPSCSLTANPFSGLQKETQTNHLGQSCGAWTYMNVQYSPVRGKFGIIKSVNTQVTPDQTGGKGTRESAYTRGSWFQALACYHQQVKSEIESAQRLGISDLGTGEGYCTGLSQKLKVLTEAADEQAKKLESQLKERKNIQDIENCENLAADETKDALTGKTFASLRQSACHLKAARAAIEALFAQLASCEVFARAQVSYDRFTENFFSEAASSKRRNDIKSACMNSSGEGAVNQCYQSNYTSIIETEVAKRYPNSGKCQ